MWVSVPLVPVIVSESARGTVLVVVSMVRVEEPEPMMAAGLKPALLTPLGNLCDGAKIVPRPGPPSR